MKMKFEVEVDAEPATVWAAFDSTDNLQKWQPTLVSIEHKTGQPGHPEAVAELTYDENGRRIVMTETITERREPDFMAGTYESNHGTSLIVNTFEKLDNGTRWTAWHNMRFSGMAKLFAIFVQKKVRKRIEDDMQRFKLMVETERANRA